MYNVPYFKANNKGEVIEFMNQNPFVILTGSDAKNHPVATHLPVLIEEREGRLFLLAHIMKQTDHHKAWMQNPNVLAIFSGAHTFISASWYKNQQQVGTWNYQAVHATGILKFLNEEELLVILQRLTAHFENDTASPSLVEHLPVDYVTRLAKAIVGFEIEVTAIDHVFKLSQNKDSETYKNIINHLNNGDDNAKQIAALMNKKETS